MVYFRIRAHCLAQQQEWKKEYDDIIPLKNDIFDYFKSYNINEESALIVYYDKQENSDQIFDNLDILPKDNTTIFDLYVKRVWSCCGVCFIPFDITPNHLPLECIEKTCNVQYCLKCVNTICELDKNHKFTCMFCNKTTDRPQRNILLENQFLWKPYTMRYGGHSIERFETIFNGANLSDLIHRIKNRQIHIQTLQMTLKQLLSTIDDQEFDAENSKTYLIEADHLNEQLESFIERLKTCEKRLKSQSVTFRNLVNNYRLSLRDNNHPKAFKQEGAAFILLCEKLSATDIESIERIKTTNEQLILSELNLVSKYQIDKLKNLLIKENSAFIDDIILPDINYRRNIFQDKQKQIAEFYLIIKNHPFHTFYSEQHTQANVMMNSFDEYEQKFILFRNIYKELENIICEYKDELTKKTLDEHKSLPTNEQMSTFECSRLILVSELLRSETEQIELKMIFPQVTKLIYQWKKNPNNDPKIYDLFSTLEQDLLCLYNSNDRLMNLIPFRVGFIGNISVGKSSLVNYLRTQYSFSTSNNRTLSPTSVGQSTVGSLQFDEKHQCPNTQTIVTIRYVDIEGCTDYNTKVQAASYFEQIRKADCDLYIILFTGQQGSFELNLEKEIHERLNRPCWFVRSKVDREFEEYFNEQLTRRKHDYPDMIIDENEENELAEQIIEMIRDKTIAICQTAVPENVFLINSIHQSREEDNQRKFNEKTYPFDINLLSERLIHMAQQSYRQERIQRMATMICAHAVGAYFRRRCIMSFISHQLRASISAVLIPWGDQISLIHTRFGIRLALGIQDRATLYNRLLKKVDALEELLLKYPLNINPDDLKSDEFNYLKLMNSAEIANRINNNKNEYSNTIQLSRVSNHNSSITRKLSSAIPAGTVACGLVGNKIAATTLALSTLGYGIGAGVLGLSLVASIPIGLWTLKKSNKQICDYLDVLCADLLIISEHFIAAIINQQIDKQEQS